ncbi:MAG TPA: AMP-binding protein [Streptosporangiaceae bacterium]|nr:AMP-binding protein [Streptosporangiaceae bacterium]
MTGHRPAERGARTFALSRAQQRQWLLRRLLPERPPGRRAWSATVTGPLDGARLAESLRRVAAAHPVLCAELVTDERAARPQWRSLPHHRLPVEYRAAPPSPFMIPAAEVWTCGPQWRARLTRTGHDEHALDVAVADGFLGEDGFARLWSQVVACHDRGSLPTDEPAFTTYVEREPAAARAAAARWAATEPLLETATELPADRPRPAWQGCDAATCDVEVPGPLWAALRERARSWDVPFDAVLLAAFAILAGRFAGHADLQLGTRLGWWGAHRDPHAASRPLGIEPEPLPVRVDLAASRTLEDLAREISRREAARPPRPSLAALVAHAKAGADLSRSPLFQVAYESGGADVAEARHLGEAAVRWGRRFAGAAPCDVLLAMPGPQPPAQGFLRYRADIFDPRTAGRLAGHYLGILADAAGKPGLPHAKLARPPAKRVIPRPPVAGDLMQDVQAAAWRTPGARAVSFGSQVLTYSGLLARAGQVASWLRVRHPGPPGTPAGRRGTGAVALEAVRHLDLAPMALGILAAGGSLVPVDSHDARAEALLTRCGVSVRLVPGADGTRISGADELTGAAGPVVSTAAYPQAALAHYLTSGSTGMPKIVVSTHAGTAHYRDYLRDVVGLGPSDVVMQLASLTFDASIRDLLCPLAAGAHVVLADDAETADAVAISQRMREAQVTAILAVVPSVLRHLVAAGPAAPPSLRVILVSGEALTPELAAAASSWAPSARVINQYGLTECTMTSTYHELGEPGTGDRGVPVGQPIPSASVHLLGADGELCPRGALGAMAIGGPGVSRGYLDPGVTAARFVPDPWGAPGSRMFLTGDLGRVGPDGELRLHGRADRQVKVRGNRVELDDAEALLRGCAGVDDAAVVFSGGELIAYLAGTADGSRVRRQLAGRAPPAMIPTRYVRLSRLPVTPSGKLDRRSLPPPARHRGPVAADPRDLAELVFAELAEDVLGHRDFRMDDDLLVTLGMPSPDVLTLALSASAATRRTLPPAAIYDARTVEALAARHGAGARRLVRLGRGRPGWRPVVVVPDAAGQAARYARLAEWVRNPLYALEGAGTQPGSQPCRDFTCLVSNCLDVLVGFPGDGLVLLGWGLGGRIAVAAAASLRGRADLAVAVVEAASERAAESATRHDTAVARYARCCTPCSWQNLPAGPGSALRTLLRDLKLRGQLPPSADMGTLRRLVAVHAAATSHAPAAVAEAACDIAVLRAVGECPQAPAWVRTTGQLAVHAGAAEWRAVPTQDDLARAAGDLAKLLEGAGR